MTAAKHGGTSASNANIRGWVGMLLLHSTLYSCSSCRWWSHILVETLAFLLISNCCVRSTNNSIGMFKLLCAVVLLSCYDAILHFSLTVPVCAPLQLTPFANYKAFSQRLELHHWSQCLQFLTKACNWLNYHASNISQPVAVLSVMKYWHCSIHSPSLASSTFLSIGEQRELMLNSEKPKCYQKYPPLAALCNTTL